MAITKTAMAIEVNETINTIATAVQFDTQSRYLDVYLYDKGVPIDLTGHQVRIHVKRKGFTTQFEQGEITDATAGRCQFELKNKMLEEAGTAEAQISIWNSDAEILSTKIFKIIVDGSIRNDEEVEASNEFGVLVVLFTEIQSALELMKEMTDTFGLPGEMAEAYGVDTFWGMMEHLAKGADVEHALKTYVNSTMGTDDETPLNVLLTAGQDAIKSVVDAVKTSLTTGGVPIVRHIQRGVVSMDNDTGAVNVTLSGFTNPNKMVVLLNGSRSTETGTSTDISLYQLSNMTDAYLYALSETTLTIRCTVPKTDAGSAYVSYQVIEYY